MADDRGARDRDAEEAAGHAPALDPLDLRQVMAAIGLTRLVSETSDGATVWVRDGGRFRLHLRDAPADLARRCAGWVEEHAPAFTWGGVLDVKFDGEAWRTHALRAQGIEAELWCAVASDGVPGREGKTQLRAPALEYAQGGGGGRSNWLGSLAAFLGHGVDRYAAGHGSAGVALAAADFARVLEGRQAPSLSEAEWSALRAGMGEAAPPRPAPLTLCRWDGALERDHAMMARAPAGDPMRQDQTVNALAAIGLSSCPSAPRRDGFATPIVMGREGGQDHLAWPVWIEPCRHATLEAALAVGPAAWRGWPVVEARRRYAAKVPVFGRGRLREPRAAVGAPEGSQRPSEP